MIKWYLNRFKTMSLSEIFFRIWQMLKSRWEKAYSVGKFPSYVRYTVSKTDWSFTQKSGETCSDIVHVFGKEYDFSKSVVDWHKDIFSGERFSLSFSKGINIRHNENLSAKNVWEINRLQCLVNVALNYHNTGNNKYLDQFTNLLGSWIEKNPYLVGVNWYSNIEVNIRLIVFYFCWEILRAEDIMASNREFKNFIDTEWIPTIYQHCKYSYANPSKFSSSNNHLISEYAGLFIATTLWNFNESKKWNRFAKNGLEREIVRQHSARGLNKEEAAEYIQFITDFFLLSYVAGENSRNSFSDTYKNQLKEIFKYIHDFLDISGNFPQYGDEDDGKVITFDRKGPFNNFKSLLTSGTILFNDAELKRKSNGIDIKNKVLFGDNCIEKFDSIEVKEQTEDSAFYPEEGHFFFRKCEADKEIYLHLNAAPLGYLSIAAHGHSDALAFLMHINGNPFFIDSGTYSYHVSKEWRNYFVSSKAHNTITLDNKNQANHVADTMWLNHYKCKIIDHIKSGDYEKVVATHNGYKGAKHTRSVEFIKSKDEFLITDELQTLDGKPHTLFFPFHLHPEVVVEKNNFGFLLEKDSIKVQLITNKYLNFKVINGETSPILGWYSPSFMVKQPTNVICSELKFNKTISINSIIKVIAY